MFYHQAAELVSFDMLWVSSEDLMTGIIHLVVSWIVLPCSLATVVSGICHCIWEIFPLDGKPCNPSEHEIYQNHVYSWRPYLNQ
jgi:hypothetical protein